MRKITKFLVTGFLLLTSAIGITTVGNNETKEVEAAAGGTATLKLDSSYWGSLDAYYSIHYWGGDTSTTWPGSKFNGGKSAKGNVEITAPYDETSTHCIIIRYRDSSYTNEWERWDYFDKNSFAGNKYNYFTNNGEGSCSSTYVENTIVREEYKVTFYHDNENIGTKKYTEGDTFNSEFIEREGYRFEGWYTDASLTNEFVTGSEIKSDMDLYGKYVEASDYTIYFEDNGTFGSSVYVYLFDGDRNNTWPGVEISKNDDDKWAVVIDVSKGWSNIIFGNGQDEHVNSNKNPDWIQTNTLSLEGAAEGYTYVLGEKNSSGKYSATLVAAPLTAPALSIYATPIENSGIRFVTGFPADMASEIRNNNVGFKFVFSGDSVDTKTGFYVCESTFESATIITNGEGQIENAADNGFAFYFGVRIVNIPEGYTKVEVTPTYQHLNYDTVYCPTVTYTITNSNDVITLA